MIEALGRCAGIVDPRGQGFKRDVYDLSNAVGRIQLDRAGFVDAERAAKSGCPGLRERLAGDCAYNHLALLDEVPNPHEHRRVNRRVATELVDRLAVDDPKISAVGRANRALVLPMLPWRLREQLFESWWLFARHADALREVAFELTKHFCGDGREHDAHCERPEQRTCPGLTATS